MKATITKVDGTKVELEGLTDDVVRAVRELSLPQFAPVSVPSLWPLEPWPNSPTITWTSTTVTPEPA